MDHHALIHEFVGDMERLHKLIVRVAMGERHLTRERDQLQNALDVKMARLGAGTRSEEGAVTLNIG